MRMPDLMEKIGPILMLIGAIFATVSFVIYLLWAFENSTIFFITVFISYIALAVLSIFGLVLDLRGKKFGNIFPLIMGIFLLGFTLYYWVILGWESGRRYGLGLVYINLPGILLVITGSIINLIVFYYRRKMTK